ncbi:SLAC1 anion channel family protein [Meridianimarinicoccus sp. RP-17]|uniref:SLAC1 anion channel family protein n=1 Tax=Meridianimarinicoccus zhengii TaxID=2056810 RepID=UPI000DAD18D5|nr:SLAC1 anion channel family protein [Phycocomes zhengii]
MTLPDAQDRLEHFPISFFAAVLGLAGLTLALHAASALLPLAGAASSVMLGVTVIAFLAIGAVYARKALRHPAAVAAEWQHPVKLAFFPAISISLMLIATALAPDRPDIARPLWLLGAVLQAGLTLAVVSCWIGHRPFQPMHISPAWFIPAVGNVVVPVAGPSLGFVELSWLFFSAGLMFWAVLLTLVMNRLIFHDPLPGRLLPTLAILIAPPAVGFLSWLSLNGGQVDAGGRLLLNLAYVFAAIVAMQAPKFLNLPFALSWWALSFPVAALTIASLRFGALAGSAFHTGLGLALLALLVVIVAALMLRTGRAIAARQICLPE